MGVGGTCHIENFDDLEIKSNGENHIEHFKVLYMAPGKAQTHIRLVSWFLQIVLQ